MDALQDFVPGLNHHNVIAGGLAPHHAVHGQQSGGLIHGKTAVRSGFDMEVSRSSAFFIKKENIAGRNEAENFEMMRLTTSADHLQLDPLRIQPRDRTEADLNFY